jgi:DNA repair protein RecN (Recombination protein N)
VVNSKSSRRSGLTELSIRNLGVIESASFELNPGLTVLTGETGAGKTMVLTALGLILGRKSDSDLVRTGQERAVISGRFTLNANLQKQVEDLGGEIEDNDVIITRTVSNQGKSRITLGGLPSTANDVATLCEELVEIHAQSSSARLTKSNIARELLDRFGGLDIYIQSYQSLYTQYRSLLQRISELKKAIATRDQKLAQLREFESAVNQIKPKVNELDEIDNLISKLGSVEALGQSTANSLNILNENDESVTVQMAQVKKNLDSVFGKDPALDSIIDRFQDVSLNLQDLISDLYSYSQSLEADPVRFEHLQERKSAINSLIKKYGVGSDRTQAYNDILNRFEQVKAAISDLDSGTDRIGELEAQAQKEFTVLKSAALSLSKARFDSAADLATKVTAELTALAMPNASLVVDIQAADPTNFENYSADGIDEVVLLFAAHSGAKALPINKAASGGELSRIMLALEVVIAEKEPVGTYIFDEVDAGVGGKAAIEVGRRLSKLSQNAQVIVVTHLAQVAAWADHHLVVKKSEDGLVTQSDVQNVSQIQRLPEIARMLSGQEDSATAQQHAKELIQLVKESVIS